LTATKTAASSISVDVANVLAISRNRSFTPPMVDTSSSLPSIGGDGLLHDHGRRARPQQCPQSDHGGDMRHFLAFAVVRDELPGFHRSVRS
jgi:hypothetical protein